MMSACTDILSLVLAAMSATETAEALAQVLAIPPASGSVASLSLIASRRS